MMFFKALRVVVEGVIIGCAMCSYVLQYLLLWWKECKR